MHAAVEDQAAGKAAVLGRLTRIGVDQQVLHGGGDARIAVREVLGPVDVGGGGRRRDELAVRVQRRQAAVGRVRDVAVFVVVDRESLARPVYALDPVEQAREVRQLAELGVVGVGRAGLGRRQVDRIGMGGKARGPEQPRVGGAKLPRTGRGGRTADRCGRAAAQLPVGRAEAVQRTNELERLGRAEVSGQPLWGALAGRRRCPPCVEVSDQDLIVAVPGPLESAPAGVDEAAVHPWRRGNGRALDRLGREVAAEVRLVPDLPEAHAGQVVRIPRDRLVLRGVVGPAVPGAHRLHELLEGGRRRLPTAEPSGRWLAGAGRPDRRRARDREVERDAVRLRVGHDLVVDAPVRRGIGGGIGRVESGRPFVRCDRAPMNRDAQHVDAELP